MYAQTVKRQKEDDSLQRTELQNFFYIIVIVIIIIVIILFRAMRPRYHTI